MASVHEYKRLENSIIRRVKDAAIVVGKGIAKFFRGIGAILSRRYTVVFVPHSEKRVYNLHVTVLSMCCFILVMTGALGAFIWHGASFSNTRQTLVRKDSHLKDAQASLDQIRDESAVLFREAKRFDEALTRALIALGGDYSYKNTPNASGDLSSFFSSITETPEGVLPEIEEIRSLSAYLARSVGQIREIGNLLDSQSALLTEIPSVWPIKGGIGHITMQFGQNVNPFSGQLYIHKGIDIATFQAGDPIVATADGQIVTIDYSDDFGNYVIIKHKHGYYTRYAHMLAARGRIGQRVQQNDIIGYVGNTGISTGAHLHYEVHVGSDVVDPYKYINIRSSIAKQGR